MPAKLRRGIYVTDYGNAAYVSGPKAKTAYDLDMGERIPIEMIDAGKRLRDTDENDELCYALRSTPKPPVWRNR